MSRFAERKLDVGADIGSGHAIGDAETCLRVGQIDQSEKSHAFEYRLLSVQNDPGQVPENASDFLLLFEGRVLQFVAQFDKFVGFDVKRRAAVRAVQNGPMKGAAIVCFQRDDRSAMAHQKSVVLDGLSQVG